MTDSFLYKAVHSVQIQFVDWNGFGNGIFHFRSWAEVFFTNRGAVSSIRCASSPVLDNSSTCIFAFWLCSVKGVRLVVLFKPLK